MWLKLFIDFARSEEEVWTNLHKEISQFTRLKGILCLEDSQLYLSCSDFEEAYTGGHNWKDYSSDFTLTPLTGQCHMVNVRVQGTIRSYAAGLMEGGKLGLFKNENGYRKLDEVYFPWKQGKEYLISVAAKGHELWVSVDGREMIRYDDTQKPYLFGGIGVSVWNGSHCSYRKIAVCG